MKKYFLSFADTRYAGDLRRISGQAAGINVFDKIYAWTEADLPGDFKAEFSKYLRRGVRGYGYWAWKPEAVRLALSKMDDGDILLYCDVGCHINAKGKKRLLEYFECAADKQSSGIVCFQRPPAPDALEYVWTKSDLFEYFGVLADRDITDTPQIIASTFIIRKSPSTVKIIDEWLGAFKSDFSLADDSPSKLPNRGGFIEHRHDQSIFSILMKMRGAKAFSHSENYPSGKFLPDGSPDWSAMEMFPLLVKRDKNKKRNILLKLCVKFYLKIRGILKR